MIDFNIITGIGSAIAGGIITAITIHMLSRGRLRINIHNIRIYTPQPDPGEEEALSRELLRSGRYPEFLEISDDVVNVFRNCDYVSNPEKYYLHPIQYTFFLFKEMGNAKKVKLMHKKIPSLVKELKGLLKQNLLEEFLIKWAPYQEVFWIQLLVSHIRGEFDIDFSPSKGKTPAHRIITDENGNYFFNLGRHRFVFPWTIRKSHKEIAQPFAQKISNIFAYEDKERLEEIVKFLEKIQWDDPNLEKVINTVRKELHRFSKIVIKGMLINSGRSPISVSGKGKLVIRAKEFEYREKGETKRIEEDLKIDISIMKDNLIEEEETIVIEGGKTVIFEAHSSKYLHELPPVIEEIYNKERECYVMFSRLDNQKTVESNHVLFKEL